MKSEHQLITTHSGQRWEQENRFTHGSSLFKALDREPEHGRIEQVEWRYDVKFPALCYLRYLLFKRSETVKGGIEQEETEITESLRSESEGWEQVIRAKDFPFLVSLLFTQLS